jgi:hypothetical protein
MIAIAVRRESRRWGRGVRGAYRGMFSGCERAPIAWLTLSGFLVRAITLITALIGRSRKSARRETRRATQLAYACGRLAQFGRAKPANLADFVTRCGAGHLWDVSRRYVDRVVRRNAVTIDIRVGSFSRERRELPYKNSRRFGTFSRWRAADDLELRRVDAATKWPLLIQDQFSLLGASQSIGLAAMSNENF